MIFPYLLPGYLDQHIQIRGIYDSKDIQDYLDLGVDGVQMATRFICTDECDADIKYKQALWNPKCPPASLPSITTKSGTTLNLRSHVLQINLAALPLETIGAIFTFVPLTKLGRFKGNPAPEIKKAKEIAKGKGMVAINAMVAITDYAAFFINHSSYLTSH